MYPYGPYPPYFPPPPQYYNIQPPPQPPAAPAKPLKPKTIAKQLKEIEEAKKAWEALLESTKKKDEKPPKLLERKFTFLETLGISVIFSVVGILTLMALLSALSRSIR